MKRSALLAAAAIFAALALPASAKTYYVDDENGDDANTGLSSTAAFKTIQKAIDKAAAGSTILVAPGTYPAIQSKNKKITVKAMEGVGSVFITDSDDSHYHPSAYAADLGAWGKQQYYATQIVFNNGKKSPLIGMGAKGYEVGLPTGDKDYVYWQRYGVYPNWYDEITIWANGGEKKCISTPVKGLKVTVWKGGTNTKLVGISFSNTPFAVAGGTLEQCVVKGAWNAVWKSSLTDCRIEGCGTISANSGPDGQYGRRMFYGTNSGAAVFQSTLNRCLLSGNHLDYDVWDNGWGNDTWGIIVNSRMNNCLIAHNTVRGWMDLIYGSSLYNCTVFNNSTGSFCFGSEKHYRSALSGCDVFNCIIWGNKDEDGTATNVETVTDATTGEVVACEYMNYSSIWYDEDNCVWETHGPFKATRTMMHSLVEDVIVEQTGNKGKNSPSKWGIPLRNSSGNITGDPLFIDPANGDYHLAPNSPCVNAGADYMKKTGKYDLDGAARKVGKVDIGAYELQPQTAVPADYDGDGVTDAAFHFAASGQWWIFQSKDGLRTISLPDRNGVPCPADYDGDGKAEPAYFTAAAKTPEFVRVKPGGTIERKAFGTKGATPVAARLSKGGPATFGVYTANAKKPTFSFPDGPTIPFGAKASRPVVADFDADGVDDLGVYTATASKPAFTILQSSKFFATGSPFLGGPLALGSKGAIPCVADYDGDGRADFATYLSNAKAPYFTRLLSSRKFRETWILPMGSKGDAPVPGVYENAFGPAIPAVWTGTKWMVLTSDWTDADLFEDFRRPAVVISVSKEFGTTANMKTYSFCLELNLVAGSVTVKIGGSTAFQDNGGGVLVGSGVIGSGTVNYNIGVIQFSFKSRPPDNQDIVVTYQYTQLE